MPAAASLPEDNIDHSSHTPHQSSSASLDPEIHNEKNGKGQNTGEYETVYEWK